MGYERERERQRERDIERKGLLKSDVVRIT